MKAKADAAVEEEPVAKKAAAMPPKGGGKRKAKADAAVEESAAAAVETECMQIKVNDRVRKISGVDKGQEGVVVEVLDDGDVRVAYKSGENTCRWIKQSANNFEKLAPADDQKPVAGVDVEPVVEPFAGVDVEPVVEWWRAAGKGEGYPPELGGEWKKEARVGVCVRVDKDTSEYWWSDSRICECGEYKKWAEELETKYPSLKPPHFHETVQHRTQQCQNNRDYCWDKLDRHMLGKVWQDRTKQKMPSRLGANLFRFDMFNNVVMKAAPPLGCSPKAVCAWEVDHIFPWARGGCSVQTNFAGVQWGANNKKRDKIIQCMGPECASELQVGLSPDAFVTLFMFCEQVLPYKRQNVRTWQDTAVDFLSRSPMARPR